MFFWGWFMGYGPLMAIFIARISRGRSIRQIVLTLSVAAPVITNFWFTIIGGSGISFEIATPGVISGPFEGFNLPAGLLAITQAMPAGLILSILFLVLTMMFVATTSDSMSYVISASMSDGEPSTALRAFWGLAMGVMALILISTGAGGIGKLQSFIVVYRGAGVADPAALALGRAAHHADARPVREARPRVRGTSPARVMPAGSFESPARTEDTRCPAPIPTRRPTPP